MLRFEQCPPFFVAHLVGDMGFKFFKNLIHIAAVWMASFLHSSLSPFSYLY